MRRSFSGVGIDERGVVSIENGAGIGFDASPNADGLHGGPFYQSLADMGFSLHVVHVSGFLAALLRLVDQWPPDPDTDGECGAWGSGHSWAVLRRFSFFD